MEAIVRWVMEHIEYTLNFIMGNKVLFLALLGLFLFIYIQRFTIYYYIEKHKKKVLGLLFIVSLFWGSFVYSDIYGLPLRQAVYYGLTQFMFDVKTPGELAFDINTTKQIGSAYYQIYWPAYIAAFTSTLTIIILFFKEGIHNLHTKYIAKQNSHIIVCGLGENNIQFINNIMKEDNQNILQVIISIIKNNKPQIIVIESDINNPYIKTYEKKENIAVIIGDAQNEGILKQARIDNCKYVIVSTGNDIVNLSILSKIRNNETNKVHTKVFTHLSRHDSEIFFDEVLFLGEDASRETHFYNYNELSARSLFKKLSLIKGINTVTNDEEVHILIIGFGDLGQEVALQAAIQGHFYNKKLIRISVVDPDIKTFESFKTMHWNIDKVCKFRTFVCNVDSPEFYEKYFSQSTEPTYVVFALGEDKLTFSSLSLFIHKLRQEHSIDNKNIPNIAVRFNKDVSQKIIDTYNKKLSPKQFCVFGATSVISTEKFIIKHEADILAKRIHENYRKIKPEEKPWEDIGNFKKDSNRAAADHKELKQDTIKRLKITTNELKQIIESTKSVIHNKKYYDLVDMEHRRWNAFHLLNGWKHDNFPKENNGNKNETLKLHGCLIETKFLKDFAKVMGKDEDYYYKNDLRNYSILLTEEKENGN